MILGQPHYVVEIRSVPNMPPRGSEAPRGGTSNANIMIHNILHAFACNSGPSWRTQRRPKLVRPGPCRGDRFQ